MIPLYTQEEFDLAKSNKLLPCKCYKCDKKFLLMKKAITQELNHKRGRCKFCSPECNNQYNNIKTKQTVTCLNCKTNFEKSQAEIKKSPNHFCSKSCAAIYRNAHKTHGTRRSKLEIHLEEQLSLLFPDLPIEYNRKDTINSELDIYIPSLKLAFELNGIFHYEPIYGSDKLNQIQNNDNRKFQACLEQSIELCIIDASGLKYFKPTNAQKYLDIIVNIINQRTYVLTS